MFAGKPFVASIVCLQAVCCGYSNIIFGRRFVADKVVVYLQAVCCGQSSIVCLHAIYGG